jgi:predicted ATPase/DNA-binding SARP family transcriptional activator
VRVDLVGVPAVHTSRARLAGAELGGRRAQVLLVALALDGAPVSGARLADMVWDGAPPATWPAALRGVVRGLRTAVAEVVGHDQELVATVPGGYALATGVETDLDAGEAALREARDLVAAGQPRGAIELLRPATALRGADVLAGQDGEWLSATRTRVDELARASWALTVDAATVAGDAPAAVSAARRLVALAPLEERSHQVLIAALDGAGDRAGAVRAFEACRAALAEELGVDPAAETVETYLRALGERTPAHRARVPRSETSFLGRGTEADELRAVLERAGLVTCTGPGGVGKSRLAAEVVAHLLEPSALPGGTWWIELEAVGADTLVLPTLALSMGLDVGDEPIEALVAALAPRGRALVVLDAVEAVVDGAAAAADELQRRCPQLTVLATSRVPLGVAGEQVVALRPWSLPDEEATTAEHPLVRLLVDRVHDRGGELSETQATGPLVRSLLDHCAGLPLAVELVAAQLAVTSPGDLADQLDELLAGADDPVRAVASSSYALLSGEEADVFRRFAVLDGPVSLALARDVVTAASVPRARVLRILGQLSAFGLLRADRTSERWRWLQDDELHRYARDLLAGSGEESAVFWQLAAAVRARLPDDPRSPPGPYAAAVTDMLPSVRSLFGAAVDGRTDTGVGLELAFRLHRYWAATNVGEGRFWLARLLEAMPARGPAEDPDARWVALATYALGYLDYWSGRSDAIPRLRTAAELLRGVDDQYVARALIFLAGLLDDTDQGPEAVTTIREAVEIAERFGPDLQMPAVMGIGSVLSERGDPEAAEHAVRAIALVRSLPTSEQLTVALPTATMICWMVGAHDLARGFAAEAMPLHDSGPRISRVVLLSAAAGLALGDGDLEGAAELAGTADREGTELGVDRELPLVRAILARARLGLGDLPGAADRAVAALDAALAMSFDFPLAIGLETAVLVLQLAGAGTSGEHAELLAAATVVRRRGDRPAPASLRLPATPVESVVREPPEPRAAARLATKLLASL